MAARTVLICTLVFGFSSGEALASDYIRDPFATLANAPDRPKTQPLIDVSRPLASQNLTLRAVLWGEKPLANISGMIVAEGDRVHDYIVLQLSRDTAILRQADKTITLVLDEDS